MKPKNSVSQPTSSSMPLSAFSEHFRPLMNKVALRRHPKATMAPGSSLLFLPDTKLKNSDRAEVLAVGAACKLGLRKGDTVIITRFADGDREVQGERLLILPESEIMAVEEG